MSRRPAPPGTLGAGSHAAGLVRVGVGAGVRVMVRVEFEVGVRVRIRRWGLSCSRPEDEVMNR